MSFARRALSAICHREWSSPGDLWAKKTTLGQFNEAIGHRAFSADDLGYNRCPFLTNPFAERHRDRFYAEEEALYEYAGSRKQRREWADKTFDLVYGLVKDYVRPEEKVLDVGCSTGYHLDLFARKGFTNLWGIDPNGRAIAHGKDERPHLNLVKGYFGRKRDDIDCDLMLWFDTVSRIPYGSNLFDAMARNTRRFVCMTTQEACNDLYRDPHYGLAKHGFMLLEKRTVTEDDKNQSGNDDFHPFGTIERRDRPFIVLGNRAKGVPTKRLFRSVCLFAKVDAF